MKNLTSLVVAALVCVGSVGCGYSGPDPEGAPVDSNSEKSCTPNLQHSFLNNAVDFKIQEAQTLVEQEQLRPKKEYRTPTRKLALSEWPSFVDDLEFENMNLAIDRQLKRFGQIDLDTRTVEFGGVKFSGTVVRESLKEFKTLMSVYLKCMGKSRAKSDCVADFNSSLRTEFDVYIPDLQPGDVRYGEKNPVLFTAYYTPTLAASSARTTDKPYAIYKKPAEKYASASRVEIDFKNALAGKGLELFYTPSLFDLYLLHVQGGGIASVVDAKGKQRQSYLTYDGTNGQTWAFISKYMIEKGYVSDGSIEAQRKFLDLHPEKQEEIFSTCPSYVYFKVTTEPPHGSDMVPLTDNRSIATDTNHYLFKGGLAFVTARRPANPYDPNEACQVGQYKAMSRFYLDQDTGGAIRGKGRVDLYFGENQYAEVAAYNTVERGNLYFLLLK